MMSRNRKLVTCPICGTDQHVYNKRICNHDNGIARCSGSKTPLSELSQGIAEFIQKTILDK